jgi:hypothetical protein
LTICAFHAALFSLASLFPVKDAQGRSPSDDVAIEDHEEPARAILVKGLRVAGTAALLYFVKEYVEYQKRSEIAAVLAKEKMYKAVSQITLRGSAFSTALYTLP